MSTAGSAITATLAALTDVGRTRHHNEDAFHVGDLAGDLTRDRAELRERITLDRGLGLGVYDGMGGMASGETASREAASVVPTSLARAPRPIDEEDLRARLIGAVSEANRAIFDRSTKEPQHRGMGTTATVAAALDGGLLFAQVGDSRGYLLRDRKLIQVTRDHTLINEVMLSGDQRFTQAELESFPRNVITRALGLNDEVKCDVTRVELRQGDVVLLCSDGLTGMVADEDIRRILLRQRDPGVACRVLCDAALRGGGHDNITIVVARFDGPGLPPPGDEPPA